MKTDIFQSCGHCWVCQIYCRIECSTLTTSSFRIWNSSAGITSLPLTLFIVIFPKARLTLPSRMSGSWWVTTPSWLSESLRTFLYSSVYSCHVFLISSASVRYLTFLSFYCANLCMKLSPGISNFLEEITSLSHSVVLPYFFALFASEVSFLSLLFSGTLHSVRHIFPFLLCLLLLFSAIFKASSDNYFAFLHFFFKKKYINFNITFLDPQETSNFLMEICN